MSIPADTDPGLPVDGTVAIGGTGTEMVITQDKRKILYWIMVGMGQCR